MTFSVLPSELETRIVGCQIITLDSTESTNIRARQLAEKGAPEGTVVLADCQTGGKGRHGRSWVSPGGVNFYASVVLRPAISPSESSQITFITSLAAVKALRESYNVKAEVKWPNDVLLNRRKLGGVLNELCTSLRQINFLILGLGVNLNMTRDQLPERALFPATSVMLEKGEEVSRKIFARDYFRWLDRLYLQYLADGFSGIREEWESCCGMVGCRIDIDTGEKTLSGLVVGIDEKGALIVRDPRGRDEKFFTGDIRLIHDSLHSTTNS